MHQTTIRWKHQKVHLSIWQLESVFDSDDLIGLDLIVEAHLTLEGEDFTICYSRPGLFLERSKVSIQLKSELNHCIEAALEALFLHIKETVEEYPNQQISDWISKETDNKEELNAS